MLKMPVEIDVLRHKTGGNNIVKKKNDMLSEDKEIPSALLRTKTSKFLQKC